VQHFLICQDSVQLARPRLGRFPIHENPVDLCPFEAVLSSILRLQRLPPDVGLLVEDGPWKTMEQNDVVEFWGRMLSFAVDLRSQTPPHICQWMFKTALLCSTLVAGCERCKAFVAPQEYRAVLTCAGARFGARVSISQMVDEYFKPTSMTTKKCSRCNTEHAAQLTIRNILFFDNGAGVPPSTLFVTVPRMVQGRVARRREFSAIADDIRVPFHHLTYANDGTEHVSGGISFRYTVSGSIDHHDASFNDKNGKHVVFGHFTAMVKHAHGPTSGSWWHYDDARVTPCADPSGTPPMCRNGGKNTYVVRYTLVAGPDLGVDGSGIPV
jgi:hypothetical protein